MANNTGSTSKHLQAWFSAKREVDYHGRGLARARGDLNNAENALGKFIAPDDAEMHESFHIWVNGDGIGAKDVLLTVKFLGNGEYSVSIRGDKS